MARRQLLEFLGGKCVVCGFDDARALQIDHVKGDGYKDVKLSAKAKETKIRTNPENYQILCANHNWIKRAENGEHVPRG